MTPFPFIVGCGRSGSTLLRAMLEAHPDLVVPPEAPFVVDLARRRGPGPPDPEELLGQLGQNERFALWGLDPEQLKRQVGTPSSLADAFRAVYRCAAEAAGAARYADKTPGNVLHLPMLADLFPEAVFVHLVRDGRDVAPSFVELGWSRSIEDAALHWRLRVLRGRESGAALAPGRYLELRYEDLVAEPEAALRRLVAAFDLRFDPAMLDHRATAGSVVAGTPHPGYHTRLQEPLTPGLRDWRRDLAPGDLVAVEVLAGDALDAFGYERSGAPVPAGSRARLAAARLRWEGRRVIHRVRRRRPPPSPPLDPTAPPGD
jgi:hypothetical protein